MNQNLKRKIKNFINKKEFNSIYENLNLFCLAGLNYSNCDFENNGELYLLKYIDAKFPNQPLTIFDVGGNVGIYSKDLANYFKDKAKIHAFEPSLITFQAFLTTTKGIDAIKANNLGIGEVKEELTLYSDKDTSGFASVYPRNMDHFDITMKQSETISIDTIDNYCLENSIDRIHFLKLDIEGHELKALKGARRMIEDRKVNFIQFEFGGANIDSRTYFQDFFYLLNEKYKLYRIVGNGLIEIPKYKESLEVFITINYLAELR